MSGGKRAKRAPARHRATREREREHVEEMLDAALMDTFPASDPVSLKACRPGSPSQSTGSDPVPRGTGPNDGRGDDGAASPRAPR